ncbi:hypothetical protein B0I72DRAFT_18247 [Yarrowia lipolytica]|jgi:hypothetical protein|uniref:YALI0C09372p n=2 Tax=Yarrowia lipolytica TaxID=4952 RepID=Q6CCH3_YARLI|nr:YALI0C09372p [Yarrowia lipolytica CLIB122]AOW02577.1 hypothetical protein YALI1_C13026g [Yarrowia lipolytica]KAB8280766.1 hypothetical protein BKA91DRAFT_175527 [Yarrowia lipolytica]KAE8169857.1 hypothetical protein BKA90DRAFT_43828 [Yarrowia lipolytica]KAJ8053256.1 hypothetical protein LXG23DRAFT_49522 [Yarrowia lipolytica]QNP96522.1 Hypothetical protein YALI2_C00175g [Yarrowia lipolytica]|eukprot:XP_501639.1 YALI0C09372p [Yarrowia lipolytica CLIB122]
MTIRLVAAGVVASSIVAFLFFGALSILLITAVPILMFVPLMIPVYMGVAFVRGGNSGLRQWIGLRPQTPTSRNNDKTDEALEAKKRQWRRASSMRLRDYMEEDDVEQIAKRVEAIRRQRDEQKTLMDELIEIDALDGTTDAVLQATEKHHQQKKQKQQQQQQQLPASIPPKAPRTPALAPQNGSGAHIVAQVVEEPATASSPTRDTGTVSPPAQRPERTDFNVKGQPEVGMTSQNVSAVLSPVAEEE